MKLSDVEVDKIYKYKYTDGNRYFATVESVSSKAVRVKLGDIVNKDGDPGEKIYALGTLEAFDVSADELEEN